MGWSEIFTEKNQFLEVLFVIHRKPRPGKGGLCLEPHRRVQTPEPTCFPPLEPPVGMPTLPCPAGSLPTGLFPDDQAPPFWEARESTSSLSQD